MNSPIRDHFLTHLYTNARFREAREQRKPSALVNFHSRNKILLMSYSQTALTQMGRIVSNLKDMGLREAIYQYKELMANAMARGPKYTSVVNTLMHCFGYISNNLSADEKTFFMDSVEMYRDDRVQLQTLRSLMRSYILRFNVEYLKEQTFFDPYPVNLMQPYGPARDKDYWN